LDNALGGGSTPSVTPSGTDLKAPSAEAKTYDVRWRQAADLASQRDYDGAVAALSKAADGLKEDEVKASIAADLDILRKVQAVYRDVLQVIAGWARNEKIPL